MEKILELVPATVFITFVLGGGVIYAIVNSIMTNFRQTRIAEQQSVLKKEMLDKGFTADEIIRVLAAGVASEPTPAELPSSVADDMIENGYESDHIAKVMNCLDLLPNSIRTEVTSNVETMVENGYSADDIIKFIETRKESTKMMEKSPDVIRVA